MECFRGASMMGPVCWRSLAERIHLTPSNYWTALGMFRRPLSIANCLFGTLLKRTLFGLERRPFLQLLEYTSFVRGLRSTCPETARPGSMVASAVFKAKGGRKREGIIEGFHGNQRNSCSNVQRWTAHSS